MGWLIALGETDCETLGDGWLAQPVNAISSLTYTFVGLVLVPWATRGHDTERLVRIAVVVGFVVTGIGSFLYHGPQSAPSGFLHDITFLALLIVLGVANTAAGAGWAPRAMWAIMALAVLGASVFLVVLPRATNVLTVASLILVIAGHLGIRRVGRLDGRWFVASIAFLTVAIVAFLAGRTGSPVCAPDGVVQGHAVWHVASAGAVAAYAVATGATREERLGR